MGTQVEKPDTDPEKDQIPQEADKALAKRELVGAKKEYEELGGWKAFKDGRFLFPLVLKAFTGYCAKAHPEDFRARYPGLDGTQIATKLITEAARFAALYGVATGAVVSTDEIVALVTGGEGGVGIPANVAIAVVAVCSEAICLVRVHLQLIANLAKLTGTPLNADDASETGRMYSAESPWNSDRWDVVPRRAMQLVDQQFGRDLSTAQILAKMCPVACIPCCVCGVRRPSNVRRHSAIVLLAR